MTDTYKSAVSFKQLSTLALLLVATLSASIAPLRADDVFRAGAATADLTPAPGVTLDGAISKPGPARGVHDRLHARALVFSHEGTTLAIVINDMCMIDQPVYDDAKQQIHGKLGIPVQNMLMAATHTHAAPRVMRIGRSQQDEDYRGFVAGKIAEAVIAAHKNLAPARIAFGSMNKPDYVACRRSLCKPGTVGVNPFGESGEQVKSVAGSSKQVIGPAGPTDPQFSVLSVQHVDGAALALLANFSVHYCGGYTGGLVSADYFGAFARNLEELSPSGDGKPAFVGAMSNGTSGNTGAVRVPSGRKAPWERMEQSGKTLAGEALALSKTLTHTVPGTLRIVESELELGVRKPDAERIAWAKTLLADAKDKGPHRWSRIYATETMYLSEYPQRYKIKLQALRIGEVAIGAIPCETFAETGLAIKSASSMKNMFTIGLANGYSGYLPPPKQHRLGGYETWPARTSHLEVDAEPKIKSRLLELLSQMAGVGTK